MDCKKMNEFSGDMNKIIDEFFAEMLRIGRSKNTIDGYAVDIRQFTRFCGAKLRKDNYAALVKGFLAAQAEQAPRTIRRKKAALKSLADYACIPFCDFKPPRIPKRLPKALRQHETEKLFAGLRRDRKSANYYRDLAIFELLYCGIRNTELRSLTNDSFAFEAKQIKVVAKGNKEVVYNLSEAAMLAVKEYLKRSKKKKTLFGFSRQALVDIVAKRSEKYIGKRITPHILRHSMAMDMLIAGADIRIVQKMLNHSSITTTMVYTEAHDDTVAKAFQACHPHS